MLEIVLSEKEYFDEERQKFFEVPPTTVHLEHSLVSISKWEAQYKRAFLTAQQKTPEELEYYFRCMLLSPTSELVFRILVSNHSRVIVEYIQDDQTATTFHDNPNSPPSREVITSELVYYWMTAYNIPFTCETWHINRLITLVRVCGLKQQKPKKMSRSSMIQRRNQLNAQRRAAAGSGG